MPDLRAAYLDLDGTLLGRGGSLVHDGEGRPDVLGVKAIEACHRAGVEVVLISGRRSTQLAEDARLLGARSYVYEAGAALVVDGEEFWSVGDFDPHGPTAIHEQITASGAPELLLEHYAGRLEYHEPWHLEREVSHLFRGLVDAFEVDELLARRGCEGLRLVDNGVVNRRSEALAALPQVRAYHLVPIDASKGQAVARHLRIRGLKPDQAIVVGDSREDMGTHRFVGTFWFVANALQRDPTLREAIAGADNVRVAEAGHGAGVYEAIVTTLRGG